MAVVIKRQDPPTCADFHEAISTRSDRWYGVCLKITRNPDMANDAVQEALVSAWAQRKSFQHTARLDTWIHRFAVNAALQLLRKNRPWEFQPFDEAAAVDSDSPGAVMSEWQLAGELVEALNYLTEIERVCFVLKHLEEWKLKEIAAELDVSLGTVKQALFRGVRKLRVSMSDLQSETV